MVSLKSLDNLKEDAFIIGCAIRTGLFKLVESSENGRMIIKSANSERCYSPEDFMREPFYQGMKDALKGNGLHNPHSPYTPQGQEYNCGYAKGKPYSGHFQLAMQRMNREGWKWN